MYGDERLSGYRIRQLGVLLVDDNAFMRTIIRGMLNTLGVRSVVEAANGIEALEIIGETPPDVILLDWEMPVLNGPELVRIIRTSGKVSRSDVPIIMLTGHAEEARLKTAVELGVNDFMCKPVSVNALRNRLTTLIAKPPRPARLVAQLPD
jgi:CheY-like chemotaxis protein